MTRITQGGFDGAVAAVAVSFGLANGEAQVAGLANPLPVTFVANGAGVSSAPIADPVPVVPGANPLPDGPCRAIIATVAGTVNIISLKGNQRDGVPLNVGTNAIGATHIRPGGTASGLFAGY